MNLALDAVLLFYACFLSVASYASVASLPLMPKVRDAPSGTNDKVSIIVPVKDEGDTLRESLESMVGLDYPNKEIVVVYGDSSDDTGRVLGDFEGRVRTLAEPERPHGWVGKSWACHCGSLEATGEFLLFTDGDVVMRPGCLSAAMKYMELSGTGLLSCWPRINTRAPSERLLLPVGLFMLSAGITAVATVKTASGKVVRGANGQFILVSKSDYASIGGHASVRGAILEDAELGRRALDAGLRVVNASGTGLMEVKPYSNRRELARAFERFGAGVIPSLGLLVGVVAFIFLYFVSPFVLLGAGLALRSPELAASGLAGLAVVAATSSVFFWLYSRLRYLPTFPVGGAALAACFVRGFRRYRSRGVEWKGVPYRRGDAPSGERAS